MIRIEEGSLAFEFGEQWSICKFDDHPDYRKGIARIDNTKAVDFLGIFKSSELYFVEVKNFRRHRIENKERLSSGQLAIEVAQKVKDSLAGIVGAFHSSSEPEYWQPYVRQLCTAKSQLKVVLWLEEDLPKYPQSRKKARASTITKKFQQKLAWLTKRVLVCESDGHTLPDVTVSNLPTK